MVICLRSASFIDPSFFEAQIWSVCLMFFSQGIELYSTWHAASEHQMCAWSVCRPDDAPSRRLPPGSRALGPSQALQAPSREAVVAADSPCLLSPVPSPSLWNTQTVSSMHRILGSRGKRWPPVAYKTALSWSPFQYSWAPQSPSHVHTDTWLQKDQKRKATCVVWSRR